MITWTSAQLAVMEAAGCLPSTEIPADIHRILYLEPLFGEFGAEVLLYVALFKESLGMDHSGSISRALNNLATAKDQDALAIFDMWAQTPRYADAITIPKAFLYSYLQDELSVFLPVEEPAPEAFNVFVVALFAVANQKAPVATDAYSAAENMRDRIINPW